MDFYEYAWKKAVDIALKCLEEGGITKSLMRKQGRDFEDLMAGDLFNRYEDERTGVYDGYADLIGEECGNYIEIPPVYHQSLLKEIERNIGVKEYARLTGLNPEYDKEMLLSDWAWDIVENPKCILGKREFWMDVWKKLPETKLKVYTTRMKGHNTRAPKRPCIAVNFRSMI